jgi:glycosyltransferase 2 family protein
LSFVALPLQCANIFQRIAHVKKLLITLLKISFSVVIIAYLVYDATQSKAHGNVFANLSSQPKQWDMLAAAWVCCTVAVLLTFIRWWYLVRALDIPCRFRDAIRISFWGYLFNLAPLGIVGGDLVKTVMLGHEHPQHRAKALASVLVDRVIGLYILFIVASTAILLTRFWTIPGMGQICSGTFIVTVIGTVGLGVVLGPDITNGRAGRMIGRIPRIGPPLESLINAVRMYNRKPVVLLLSSLMTVAVHLSFAVGCYLIACGLPGNHLSLADHLVVMPLGSALGVIPITIGPLEFAVDFFYANVPVAGPPIAAGQGLVVALVYRLITLLIAALGTFYYFRNRREMTEVMHEAEQEEPA